MALSIHALTQLATVKDEQLEGVKLLLLQPLNYVLCEWGRPMVAIDSVQAGEGELVFWVGGREATMAIPGRLVVSDVAIVGIVDQVSSEE